MLDIFGSLSKSHKKALFTIWIFFIQESAHQVKEEEEEEEEEKDKKK